MGVALYPGSFDPIHNGHVSVIATAAAVFGQVIVAVGHNPAKPGGFLPVEERIGLIADAVAGFANVTVTSFTGLVTVAANEAGATCLVKGVRSGSDLDGEMLQANMNAETGAVPTVFLPGLGRYAMISSRYVREIAGAGGDVAMVVPAAVANRLAELTSPDRSGEGATA